MTENLTSTPYELIGGETQLRVLVERFYFYMDTLPEAKGIRSKHTQDLSIAKGALFKFLSGWLGGPDLFIQEFGHPRLRRRHLKFIIEHSDKEQWMMCLTKAMAEMTVNEVLKTRLLASLDQLAMRMVNQ
ncbi:MAG: group II truncated hemoglobin [Methylococcales bacterium]|jgi:hemoglobin